MRLTLFPALAAPLLLLAACGEEAAPADEGARSATSDVLQGSTSDAMLPLATVRSQPPLEDPGTGEDDAPRGAGPAAPIQPFGGTATREEPAASAAQGGEEAPAPQQPEAPAPTEE